MKTRFLPLRRSRSALLFATSLLIGVHVPALSAPPVREPTATDVAVARPWWTVFNESTLDLLLAGLPEERADRARRLALETQASAAYVQARVYSVRLRNARALREIAERQIVVLGQARAQPEELARAEAFLRLCAGREHGFLLARSEAIATLAEALGGIYPTKLLARALEPALSESRLPWPEVELPEALSGLVLRHRPDVMAAEHALAVSARGSDLDQLRLARYLQALSDEIHPGPEGMGAPAEPAVAEDVFARVLWDARRDIADRLGRLDTLGRGVAEMARRVHQLEERNEALHAATPRPGESVLLSAAQELLVARDWLAAAIGVADLEWIAFQRSTGGVAQASLAELLGGAPAQD